MFVIFGSVEVGKQETAWLLSHTDTGVPHPLTSCVTSSRECASIWVWKQYR